jgi:hypothetical protein
MGTDQNPAIELLVAQIEELERKANAYRASVNFLCEKDGKPPLFPDNGGGGGGRVNGPERSQGSSSAPVQIKPDTFYGRPQQTAVREFLAIRKAAGAGPAKPLEILEGLRAGGYQVEAKTDEIALVGLRAMLRKRSTVFHKLPNGAWGLKEWYPNAKPPKAATPAAGAPDQPKEDDPDAAHDLANDMEEEPPATDAAKTSVA